MALDELRQNDLSSASLGRCETVLTNNGDATEWIEALGSITVQVKKGAATVWDINIERATRADKGDAAAVSSMDETELAANFDGEGFSFWRVKASAAPTGGPITITITYRKD